MLEHVAEAVEVTTAGGVDAELAADALWQAGAAAVEERSVPGGTLLVAATEDGSGAPALAAAVAGRWPAEVVAVDAGAALDSWRAHARAVTVGSVTVRPPWVPPPAPGSSTMPPAAGGHGGAPGPVEIVVDPGRAFGSGSHASTRLALAAVADLVRGGESVLDVGCGSGVLAIAALALGARHAVGVDVDPAARAATLANADRNGVAGRLTVHASLAEVVASGETALPVAAAEGSGRPRPGGSGRPRPLPSGSGWRRPGGTGFDLVVANVLAPVLVELAPTLRRTLAPGGTLVLSGLLGAQRATVLAAHPDLTPAGDRAEGEWVALMLRRTRPGEPAPGG
jgi:ribosomal protein L11 methyltransferase